MKSKFLACLVLLPALALAQAYKWKIQPLVIQPDRSYVWSFDSSEAFHYYSAEDKKNYVIDSLVYKSHLTDSLCKDITILSLQARRYFELLQEAYLELRRLKSDSLADKMRWVEFDKRFRI